jgi:hypothetical protein
MLPLIPLACLAFIAGGGVGLGWYYTIDDDKRRKADRIANDIAWEMYRTSMSNLTQDQANRVAALVRKQLGV